MLNFGQVCNVILEKIDKFFIFFVVFFNIYIEVNCGVKFLRWCLRKLKVCLMCVFIECKVLDVICIEFLIFLLVIWMFFIDFEL